MLTGEPQSVWDQGMPAHEETLECVQDPSRVPTSLNGARQVEWQSWPMLECWIVTPPLL